MIYGVSIAVREPVRSVDHGAAEETMQIAEELADFVVITDDNPRSEDAETIRNQIAGGFKTTENLKNIGDRKEAIGFAIDKMSSEDVLVVAGKGHEQGQVIGGKIEPFDDAETVMEFLGMKEGVKS